MTERTEFSDPEGGLLPEVVEAPVADNETNVDPKTPPFEERGAGAPAPRRVGLDRFGSPQTLVFEF